MDICVNLIDSMENMHLHLFGRNNSELRRTGQYQPLVYQTSCLYTHSLILLAIILLQR